jgi:copper chaperone CopZ
MRSIAAVDTPLPYEGVVPALAGPRAHVFRPGVSCGHCRAAITQEVTQVPGVESDDVDLDAKRVNVRGAGLDDADIRAAIDAAGYDIAA